MDEFIRWRDAWSFGVEHLDDQHRHVANLLNRLVCECCRGQTAKRNISDSRKRMLKGLLDELYTCVKRHFSDEEALMVQARYPGFVEHAREHAMLLGEFKSTFGERFDQGRCNMDAQTLEALKAWFVVHVARSDTEFADYLDARRAAADGVSADAGERRPGGR